MEIIAHRGMHGGDIIENSNEALMGVLASVADGVETDVRLTSDNVCVVYHDSKTTQLKHVIDASISEIHEHEEHVLRIEEALSIFQNYQGLVNVEIKHIFGEKGSGLGGKCLEKLKVSIQQNPIDNLLLSSFSHRNIKIARQLMPDIPRAYLVPAFMPISIAIHRAKKLQCNAIHLYLFQMRQPFIKFFIRKAHKHGLKVRVHTVNSVKDMKRLKALGIDGVFTDDVVLLKENLTD